MLCQAGAEPLPGCCCAAQVMSKTQLPLLTSVIMLGQAFLSAPAGLRAKRSIADRNQVQAEPLPRPCGSIPGTHCQLLRCAKVCALGLSLPGQLVPLAVHGVPYHRKLCWCWRVTH